MNNTNPNAKHRNPFAQSCWFASPSHAWLAVPREMLRKFDLEKDISSYSYQKTHPDGTQLVFLEEDCDATLVINKVGLWLYKIAYGNGWIQEMDITDNFIHNSDQFQA